MVEFERIALPLQLFAEMEHEGPYLEYNSHDLDATGVCRKKRLNNARHVALARAAT